MPKKIFSRLTTAHKIIVLYLLILLITISFMPVLTYTPVNVLAGNSNTQIIKLFSWSFFATYFISLVTIMIMWAYALSTRVSTFVSTAFWLSEPVMSFVWHMILVGMFYAIGNTLAVVNQTASASIGVAYGYYVRGGVLICWLIITILLILKQWRLHHRSQVTNHAHPQESSTKETFKNLFES